ncbi:MAG: hypothetical protein M3N48_05340 [Verrucomicrobiota bacterium]|nr:hypothetical protein [Verrucomicrobiota bacterium]
MRQSLLILGMLAAALPQLAASPENAAIVTAAETYLKANASITTKINFTVEKIDGDFARVKINPQDKSAADPAWMFLKKKEGKWTGLTLGTGFSPEDYQQLGIPKSLRVD